MSPKRYGSIEYDELIKHLNSNMETSKGQMENELISFKICIQVSLSWDGLADKESANRWLQTMNDW